MKKVLFCIVLFLISCKPDDNTPTATVNNNFTPNPDALRRSGNFIGNGHSVSGTATLYNDNGARTLVLDPFMTQNGPDLKVYLSNDIGASSYISLGDLKSTTDKQSYDVPENLDLTGYDFALIWCEQFSVLFGSAELK